MTVEVTWVGAGALAAADPGPISPEIPGDATTGDFVVLFVGGREDSPAFDVTTPTDWTPIGTVAYLDIGTSAIALQAFYKFHDGSESAPTVSATDNSIEIYGFIAAWRGVDPTTPLDAGPWSA